jgi:hypothetical protein
VQAVLAGSPKCRCGPVRAFIAGGYFSGDGPVRAVWRSPPRAHKLVPSDDQRSQSSRIGHDLSGRGCKPVTREFKATATVSAAYCACHRHTGSK